jgi:hypothetical protein
VINFAREGIAGVGLVTERFAEEAEFIASSAGMPNAPWLRLPYPVAGTGDVAMRELAVSLVPLIISSLRGDR